MSRTTKRFLSMLLAAAMLLSLGITGWAIDDGDITIVDPETEAARQKDEHVTAGFDGGTELELKEIDPDTLPIERLGEIEEEDEIEVAEEDLFDPDEIVRVSIVLNKAATMAAGYQSQNIARNSSARAYRDTLKRQQASVEKAIASAGVSMNVKWNLTLAVNIISAEVRYGDIETIKSISGVEDVFLENRYEPQVDEINTSVTTGYMIGATQTWASGYTGAGTKVAIIDTGTDQDHQSFSAEALEYALAKDGLTPDLLTWEDIEAVKDQLNANTHRGNTGLTQEVYKNTKIPYAYNYIDGGYVTDHMSDTQEEHGSHVSGIAAANRFVKINGEFVDAAENVYAVGAAPDAQILTMKVFGKGGGAYDSDYMAAIEDALVLGADSVNLSLGSGQPGYTFSGQYEKTMNSLVDSGTVVSISAGNAYNWASFIPNQYPYLYLEDVSLHTGGSPGSFVNSLCVAAAQNIGKVTAPLYFNGDMKILFNEPSGDGNEPIASIAGDYEYILLDGPGVDDNGHVGQAGDTFFELGREVVEGKIALCYRGTSSFFAKANAAAGQGAAATIIINNTAGALNMALTGYSYSAPVIALLKDDGDAIKAASTPVTDDAGNILYYTGTVKVTSDPVVEFTSERKDATITEFSSWGVPGSLIMKPEITAPGGDIYSVFGSNKHSDGSIAGGSDQYEFMSGTSMAAPHITGMAALVSQYVKETGLDKTTGQNSRTLVNSLMMSTATPMRPEGSYLSVLQQGSGLADTSLATQAKSYILMGDDATASAADGKVKVELGQDAAREGEYSFSFSINNFSDKPIAYELKTDLFTQGAAPDPSGNLRLLTATMDFEEGEDFTVAYEYYSAPLGGHDVNKDGATDRADVQAILDCLTGKVDGSALDLAAGEMDGVEGLSSYDAKLLLDWLESEVPLEGLVVPAGGKVTVKVYITYSDGLKEFLDAYFTGGAWIEGFTYVTPDTVTNDGEILDVEHSIPILGFYGSFTDASMFDCVDPISVAYGSTKQSYTGNSVTNYLSVNNGKGNKIFMGNPYAVEDEFPADRLAISPSAKLANFKYNQIRNAATTGWMICDEDGNILKSAIGGQANGAWYYVNGQAWQETGIRTANLNTQVNSLGLNEGDKFSVGFFAIPEYYGMMLHPGEAVTRVTDAEIAQLLADGELGQGSYLGYTLQVDGTAPEAEAKINDDKTLITVTAKDNNYIAFIGIMDVSGNTIFAGEVPAQSAPGEEVEVTFDISDLELPNGIAIFAGDYAANEVAYLVVFDPSQPVMGTRTVWMLTNTLQDGKDYIIAAENAAGDVHVLLDQGVNQYTGAAVLQAVTDENGTYFEDKDVNNKLVWSAAGTRTFTLTNKDSGGGLGYDDYDLAYVSFGGQYAAYADSFSYRNNRLTTGRNGMKWNGTSFVYSSSPGNIYLFTPTDIEVEMDPSKASEVIVSPASANLILGISPTIELLADVEPIVLPDRTVTWTSSDESVATVDAAGLVTAVGVGSAVITATSNYTPEVFGTCSINVLASEPMDAVVYAQVAFGSEDIEYARIDLSDMSVNNLSGTEMYSAFYGGGRSGDFIYGTDSDNDTHRFDAENGFLEDGEYGYAMNATYAAIDVACFAPFTIADYANVTEENPDPAIGVYNFIYSGITSGSLLAYYTPEKSLNYFDVSDLGTFIAITFAGIEQDEETGLISYDYLLLADDGTLYLWTLTPAIGDSGEWDDLTADIATVAFVKVFAPGEDLKAYSMSIYESEDDIGVFIADSSSGSIYYVSILERDASGSVNAHFVGKVDGATSLSSLADFDYDTLTDLGVIEINNPDGGNRIGTTVPEILRDIPMSGAEFHAVKAQLEDTGIDDEIEIDVVGGLDAIRTPITRSAFELTAAELVNPEYEEDGYVEISLTTPDLEGVELFCNGFATVEYDPELMSFKSFEPSAGLEITSFHVDEENGLIKFAYASGEGVEAGSVAKVTFTVPTAETKITVTTKEANDNLAVADVTEIPFSAPFEISDTEITVPAQSYYQLSATGPKDLTWSSDNESVATVDQNGKVFAKLYGKAVISVTDGKTTLTCTVNVLFSDVVDPSYYFAPVYWAAENGITKGYETGANIGKFGVGFNCQRRELMIFLWRYAGEPTVDKDGNPYGDAQTMFNDLKSYGASTATNKAIAWACTEGITKGYSDGGFHPTDPIVRKDVMILLYRLAGKPAVSGTLTFPDCPYKPGTDTYNAILWGSQNAITKGYSDGSFGPLLYCLREQIVTFLYRYDNLD